MLQAKQMQRRPLLVLAALFTQLAVSQPQAPAADSTLEIRVSYAGGGVVDSSHKLYIMLWDTPDFAKDDSKFKPLDSKALTSKSGSVQFSKIKKGPVYVSMSYSPNTAAPSVFLYSTEQGIPTPINLKSGQTTSITARFDDSSRMPVATHPRP
jgi:hypothetical protein